MWLPLSQDTLSDQVQVLVRNVAQVSQSLIPIHPRNLLTLLLNFSDSQRQVSPILNPALTTIKSGSSVETLPAFLDWTTLFIDR